MVFTIANGRLERLEKRRGRGKGRDLDVAPPRDAVGGVWDEGGAARAPTGGKKEADGESPRFQEGGKTCAAASSHRIVRTMGGR